MKQKINFLMRVVGILFFLGIGFIIGQTVSIDKSLPIFRYRSISEYEIMQSIGLTVLKGSDGKFYHKGIYSKRKRQQLVPWFGKEINLVNFSDSIISFNPQQQFTEFDTSIVFFSGEEVIPKCVGNTRILINWKSQIDTFYLTVRKKDGIYSVDVRK